MLAHVIGEVDTFYTVLLAVSPRICLTIFMEIDLYVTNTEQKISWHSYLRHGVINLQNQHNVNEEIFKCGYTVYTITITS